ncbi:MAG: type II toxin-antitoxin system HicB family antitoxin [Chloroflexi bacterium]|nr:type II toxin-antitoxin system HicB family antitoxin [Chloroflexota bacterium]
MTTFEYPVVLEEDDNDTILASVPDVPGVHSYGEDNADAIDHVREALIVMLSAMMDDNKDIPTPGRVTRGQASVTVPTLVASKLVLYTSMKDQGITRSELARRLGGKNPTHVTRLLNVLHQSRHDQIDEALAVLGRRLVVEAKSTPSLAVR